MLGLEIVFAVTASVLSALSLWTHRSIRHLRVGRSFWIPVFVSSTLFLIGSVVAILFELGISLPLIYLTTTEFIQLTRIFAVCTLVGGIYSYSRQVRSILPKEEPQTKPDLKVTMKLETEHADEEGVQKVAQNQEPSFETIEIQEGKETETIQCKHELGYLQTLAKDAPLPDECFSCDRIIDCKHSPIKKTVQTSA